MPVETPKTLLRIRYDDAAQQYLRKLPLKHFAEFVSQARQRAITLASLALVRARCPEFHVFNELLVQYALPRRKTPGQVVPDNMVVIYPGPIEADWSYDLPLQPVGPFWVLEYVSKGNRRKDYADNMRKYEQELKVPYYLLFEPDKNEMTLFRHIGERYVPVAPGVNGRRKIEELEIEVALHDGWVRFWHRGELLPLPGEILDNLEAAQRELTTTKRRADAATRRADAATRRAEAEKQARLAAERELAELRAKIDAEKR